MSDAMQKVEGIRHLPVFPLSLVLLPNELLPLHIFEPRYRKMLKDVQHEQNIMGISFFDSGDESSGEQPEPGTIGCAAEIHDVQELPDGRSNILTTGLIRYRLLNYVDTGEPYLVGEVEFFKDDPEDEDALNLLTDEVFGLFERIARAAFKLSGSRGAFPEIPRTDPEQLSFLITAAFNPDNELKYRMAEMTSTIERLEKLREILLQTVGKMEGDAEIQKISRTNGHGRKKIDL
jgi:Lon protease-like protein